MAASGAVRSPLRGRAAHAAAAAPAGAGLRRWTGCVLFLWVYFNCVGGPPEFTRAQDIGGLAADADPTGGYMLIGIFLMTLPALWARRTVALRLIGAMWPLLLLIALFLASSTWALDPPASIRRVIRLVVTLLTIIGLVTGIGDHRRLHLLMAAACVAIMALEAAVTAALPVYAMMDDGLAALHVTKNVAGLVFMYAAMTIGFALSLVRARLPRFVLGIALCVTLALLVLTRSTTSQSLVILTAVLAPIIVTLAGMRGRLRVALLVGAAAVIITPVYLKFAIDMSTAADPLALLRGATFSERTDIWNFMLDEIAKRPMLGAGYGSFWQIDPAIQPSLKTDGWIADAKINEGHDGYLDVLVSNGVVGLALAMVVVFHTFRLAFAALGRATRNRAAMPLAVFQLCFLIVFCIHNVTESSLFFNTTTLGTLFLLVMVQLQWWQLGAEGKA